MPNRLAKESSPYLLQHANNPVDWYPWGDEALEKARSENKLLIVSIGYATCHWCHVMERESFEDEATAQYMNEHFVNIKIDREERPDIDQVFMEVCQILNGSGGWPLNVFLKPDGKPFFAGTYYPTTSFQNRPSWRHLMEHLQGIWKDNPEMINE
ncbi:MAG: thioredoxin domain-containing protein, partial [Saprospiraceae bacterium]|nr:thioredoxin domain-containing protein [Saprospiraceae bacterium]